MPFPRLFAALRREYNLAPLPSLRKLLKIGPAYKSTASKQANAAVHAPPAQAFAATVGAAAGEGAGATGADDGASAGYETAFCSTALACCLVFCLKVGACVAVCAFACYRSGVGVEGVEPLPRIELANFMAKAEEGAA